jgi:hypothetical protein
MVNSWSPRGAEKHLMNDAYGKYIEGLSILTHPELLGIELRSENGSERGSKDVDLAQSLIWNGLRQIILYTNHPANRAPLLKAAPHYVEALKLAEALPDQWLEEASSGYNPVSIALAFGRPLPIRNVRTYRLIARNEKNEVKVRETLDTFDLSPLFDPNVTERNFKGVNNI